MNHVSQKIHVGLYLRGDKLDPDLLSAIVGTIPSAWQRKGETVATSTGRIVTKNIGLWALISESESLSQSIDEVIRLADKPLKWTETERQALTSLPGVEEGYIDIFIGGTSVTLGGGTCEFELSEVQTAAIAKLRLPICFTIAIVPEK